MILDILLYNSRFNLGIQIKIVMRHSEFYFMRFSIRFLKEVRMYMYINSFESCKSIINARYDMVSHYTNTINYFTKTI